MREVWNYLISTRKPTVSWSVPGARLLKCAAVSPGMSPVVTATAPALFWAMSASNKSWIKSRIRSWPWAATVRMTVSTPDTPFLSQTSRFWREPPPRSSSSSPASPYSELMKCWGMISPSQAGIIWVTKEMKCAWFTVSSVLLGEYVKDVDDILLPREPLLDHKFPRPIMERGYCNGIWATIDDNEQNKRDCNDEYPQPLSAFGSDVEFWICCFWNLLFLFLENIERQTEKHLQGSDVLHAGRECYHQGKTQSQIRI